MDFKHIFNIAQSFIRTNSPTILTGVAVTGVVSTTYLAIRATSKACQILQKEEDRVHDWRETVRLTWKLYIPTISTAALTIGCIIGANSIHLRRNAAVVAAYSLADKTIAEYRGRIDDILGEGSRQKIDDAVAESRVQNNPVSHNEVLLTGVGEMLCYDSYTGRYFKSDMELLRKAENDINRQILNSFDASLNDFYNLIGIPPIPSGEEMGWNSSHILELGFTSMISDDNRPCLVVSYFPPPKPAYYRTH